MRYIFTYILCFIGFFAISQNKQILYGFEDIPQTLLVNPGIQVNQKMHIGIPLLSQIHLNGGSSGVTVYDIFRQGNDDINSRILKKIHEMKSSDFLTSTVQLQLIDFGWRSQNDIYFSGGIYQELDFVAYFPKDLAILAFEGNKNYIGTNFSLEDLTATGDLTTVYHFGLNKQVNDKFTVGARLKLYSSMLSFRSVNNSGNFVTNYGEENIYQHNMENMNLYLQTAGIVSLEDLNQEERISQILGRSFFGGNIGVGMDLGFTYNINPAWKFSASALDIGGIFNFNDVKTYHAHGSYSLDGINLLFPILNEGEATFPYYDDIEDEIDEEILIDETLTSYFQLRPLKLNASIGYGFGKYYGYKGCNYLKMADKPSFKNNVGMHLYSIFRPKGPQAAATLFYRRKFTDNLSAKITYTADSYSFSNLGFGFSTTLGIVNFYALADNLLFYGNLAKAKNISLQVGLNIKIDQG